VSSKDDGLRLRWKISVNALYFVVYDMSVYRVDVGVTGSRRQSAVQVHVRQIRFKINPFTTGTRNLLRDHFGLSVQAVFETHSLRSPRSGFRKFRVILDAAAFQLNTANVVISSYSTTLFLHNEMIELNRSRNLKLIDRLRATR